MERTESFRKKRKEIIILFSILTAVAFALAAFMFYQWLKDQQALKETGQPSFYSLPMNKLEDGLIVKGTIDMAFDVYAESYGTRLGIRTSEKSENLYLIIPIYDVDNEGLIDFQYLISYKAKPKDYDTMNEIINQTWNDSAESTTLRLQNAMILDLPDEIKQYMAEWLESADFYEGGSFLDWCVEYNIFKTDDKQAIRSKLVPYLIMETETAGINIIIVYMFCGIAVLILIYLLVLLFHNKPMKDIDIHVEPRIKEFDL